MDNLIVGLGNPGNKYHNTRHNIGFLFLDVLANRWNGGNVLERYNSLLCTGRVAGRKVGLIKPQTYMNLSGKAVSGFTRFYKISPEDIIVIHDDIDMAPGRIKLVKGGGAGGHNGIRSISDSLGKTNYFRLKVGVGRPGQYGVHPDIPVEKYVLAPFTSDQMEILDGRLDDIVRGLELFFEDSPAAAMNLLNRLK